MLHADWGGGRTVAVAVQMREAHLHLLLAAELAPLLGRDGSRVAQGGVVSVQVLRQPLERAEGRPHVGQQPVRELLPRRHLDALLLWALSVFI